MSVGVASGATHELRRTTGWANSQPLTVSCWFYVEGSLAFEYRTPWGHDGGSLFGVAFPLVGVYDEAFTGNPFILLRYQNGASHTILGSAAVDTWYYVAAVFNGTSSPATVYSATAGGALSAPANTAGNFAGFDGGDLVLFASGDGNGLGGRLGSTKVWTAALSAAEIAREHKQAKPARHSDLYSFHPFINSTAEWAGKGNTFTQTGTVAAAAEYPPIAWERQAHIYVPAVGGGGGDEVTATVDAELAGLTASVTVVETIPSTAAAALAGLTASAAATVANPVTGTVAASLSGLTAAATVTETIPGTAAATLPGLTAAATGTIANPVTGTVAASLAGLTASATAAETIPSTVAAVLSGLTAIATATVANPVTSTVAAELAGLTASASVTASSDGDITVAAVLPGLTASATVSESIPSTVSVALAGLTASATLVESNSATVDAQLAGLTVSVTLSESITSTVSAGLPGLTASASVDVAGDITGTVAASFPGLTASITMQSGATFVASPAERSGAFAADNRVAAFVDEARSAGFSRDSRTARFQ